MLLQRFFLSRWNQVVIQGASNDLFGGNSILEDFPAGWHFFSEQNRLSFYHTCKTRTSKLKLYQEEPILAGKFISWGGTFGRTGWEPQNKVTKLLSKLVSFDDMSTFQELTCIFSPRFKRTSLNTPVIHFKTPHGNWVWFPQIKWGAVTAQSEKVLSVPATASSTPSTSCSYVALLTIKRVNPLTGELCKNGKA